MLYSIQSETRKLSRRAVHLRLHYLYSCKETETETTASKRTTWRMATAARSYEATIVVHAN